MITSLKRKMKHIEHKGGGDPLPPPDQSSAERDQLPHRVSQATGDHGPTVR